MLKKILVANRGEIALRVMRTCRRLGIETTAVYSEADAQAPFVQYADQAVPIGPPTPSESYLVIDKILDAAKKSGCEAIHPGYGFLSENPDFAKACDAAGLIFIGPKPETMIALSDKQAARKVMAEAGLPVIPGSDGNVRGEDEARTVAEKIGFPVMVKASYGGGGIGMTVATNPDKLAKALKKASQRAERAFARGEIYIEKVVPQTHHIEFQIMADGKGKAATVFERECSVQRRQQKVIEETPSPFVTGELRLEMSEQIAAAAAKIGYRNAGTFECLVDGNRNWYFLEINMRLQVEHPVTEMVTGLDLVEHQIRIASGEALSDEITNAKSSGHSIEARLYAEAPASKFLPRPGTIDKLVFPEIEGLRVDAGVASGSVITPFYDPLIAKVVAHAPGRDEAVEKLADALEKTVIDGLETNRDFLVKSLRHPVFRSGTYTTAFIADNLDELV